MFWLLFLSSIHRQVSPMYLPSPIRHSSFNPLKLGFHSQLSIDTVTQRSAITYLFIVTFNHLFPLGFLFLFWHIALLMEAFSLVSKTVYHTYSPLPSWLPTSLSAASFSVLIPMILVWFPYHVPWKTHLLSQFQLYPLCWPLFRLFL